MHCGSKFDLRHIEAQIVNFWRWSSIPDVQFCPDLRVLMVELNVLCKNILFLVMYCSIPNKNYDNSLGDFWDINVHLVYCSIGEN